MTKYIRRDVSDRAPERQQGNPMADPTAKGLGPSIRITAEQRRDAALVVEDRARVAGWPVEDTAMVLDMLGLLPPPAATGPRTVVCPTCSATVGAPCTQNGGRDTYARIHVKRTQAAREAAA